MKKHFDIKLVLVMILVIMLSITMFACNKPGGGGGGGNTNGPEVVTLGSFYNTLKEGYSQKGSSAISATDDIKILADLNVTVGIKDRTFGDEHPNRIYAQIDLGIRLTALLDRANTAGGEAGKLNGMKIELYNPATANNNVLLGITYMLNEPSVGYLEMNGQKVKVGFDTGYNTDTNEGLYNEAFNNFIKNPISAKTTISVLGIINSLTKGTGENWSIVDPINNIIKDFNLIDKIEGALKQYEDMISSLIGDQPIFDNNGNLNLDGVLTSDLANGLFSCYSYATGNPNARRYEATSATLLMNVIASQVPDYITSDTKLQLSFLKEGNNVSDFAIEALLPAFSGKIPFVTASGKEQTHDGLLFAKVVIKDIGIDKVDTLTYGEDGNPTEAAVAAAKDILGINNSYSETFDLGFEVGLNAENLKFNLNGKQYDLSGDYKLKVNAMVDLLNKTENKTKLFASLTVGGTDLIAVQYLGSTKELTVSFNNQLKNNGDAYTKVLAEAFGINLVDALKEESPEIATAVLSILFKNVSTTQSTGKESTVIGGTTYYYTREFTGIDNIMIKNIDAVDLFKKGVQAAIDESNKKDQPAADTAADPAWGAIDTTDKIKNIITGLFKYIVGAETRNGVISVKVDSVIKLLLPILTIDGNSLNATEAKAAKELLAAAYASDQNVIDAFIAIGLLPGGTMKGTLTQLDAFMIYDYVSGIKKEADYIVDYKAKNGNAEPSADLKAAFAKVVADALPGSLAGMFEGTPVFGANPLEVVTDFLRTAVVTAKVNMSGALGVSVTVSKGTFKLALNVGLSLKAGTAPTGSIAIAEGLDKNSSAVQVIDGKSWLVIGGSGEQQ